MFRFLFTNEMNNLIFPRIPAVNRSDNADAIKPVYVGEFPQVVRDEQASWLQQLVPG